MTDLVIDEPSHRLSKFFNGLGNAIRLKIVVELLDDRYYVKELAERLERSPSAISRHLKKLSDQDVVQSETVGRKRYYFLKRPDLIRAALALRSYFERNN